MVSLSLCLALVSIGPSVAVACEGAAEENVPVTPVAWSGGGACPEVGGQVNYEVLNKW